jgi:hypothetical protein
MNPVLFPHLPVLSLSKPATEIRFTGHAAGRIQGLFCQPENLKDLQTAYEVSEKAALHGIDVYIKLATPGEGRQSVFKFEHPANRQPELVSITPTSNPDDIKQPQQSSRSPHHLSKRPFINTHPSDEVIPKDLRKRGKSTLWPYGKYATPLNLHSKSVWLQDKDILHNGEFLCRASNNGYADAKTVYGLLGLKHRRLETDMDGGNLFFIPSFTDGKPHLLIGEDELKKMAKQPAFKMRREFHLIEDIEIPMDERLENIKQAISKDFKLPLNQIHILPQQDFHLDMTLVPLKFPKILVQDFGESVKLLDECIAQAEQSGNAKELKRLKRLKEYTPRYEAALKKAGRATSKEMINSLKALGFDPIPAPMVFGEKFYDFVNFANTQVHEEEDGKLYMFTMQSSSDLLNQAYRKKMHSLLPELGDIYTFSGGSGPCGRNAMENRLTRRLGGFHCAFAEWMA